MPYMFTLPQQVQIEEFYQAGPVQQYQAGDFADMYSYIATVLSTGNPPPDSDLDVLKSRLWFDGATKANSGSGVFSILIRDYTQTQGKLHYGREFSQGVGPSGIQEASNEVARRVHGTVAASGWQVPTIKDIADDDASGVGETLFSRDTQDTAFTNNAAWSGAILFTLLGDDQTWRWLGPETAPVADTLDDYRNALFGRISYNDAFAASLVYSPWEAFHDGSMSGLIGDMRTFAETCWMSGAFFRTGCDPTFAALLSGTVAEPTFASVGMSVPDDRALALMRSGDTGQIVLADAGDTTGAAHRFFATIGSNGQAANTTVLSPDALYAQAHGSGASGNEARQALLALSPFVVSAGGSPPPGPEVASMTPQYLADRRDMLAARLAFDAANLAYDQTLSRYTVLRGTVFTDMSANLMLAEDNPLLPGAPRDVFGIKTRQIA
jgi:hypothetical protein